METLNQFIGLQTSISKTNNNIIIKRWYYYKENEFNILEYHYSEYIDKNKTYKNEKYYNTHDSYTETILSIDEWLETNLTHLIQSNDNYKQALNTIDYIQKHLGNYKYINYKYVWYIPKVIKLTVDLYCNKVILYYKDTETILCDKKLKSFIQKNKKTILYAQNKLKEQNNNKIIQKKQIEINEKEQQKLLETPNVVKKIKPTYFYIKKSLKERYEIQACKPLPVTHSWE
jgi:hypothetical protein